MKIDNQEEYITASTEDLLLHIVRLLSGQQLLLAQMIENQKRQIEGMTAEESKKMADEVHQAMKEVYETIRSQYVETVQ